MARLGPSRSRRWLTAVLAVGLAFGLLHGPSMMLAAAAPLSGDCHAGVAKHSAAQSHAVSHNHLAPADVNDDAAAADNSGNAIPPPSTCPLANITAVAFVAAVLAPADRSSRVQTSEPGPLVPAILDRPDPPPRLAA